MNQTIKQGKRYSPTIKFQAALEVIKGKEPGQVGKAYGVHPTSITGWKVMRIKEASLRKNQTAQVKKISRELVKSINN